MNRRKAKKVLTFMLMVLLSVSLNIQISLPGSFRDISQSLNIELGTKVYAFDPALDPCPIAAGDHNLTIMGNGTLKVWGWNGHGQLGLGDESNRLSPTSILTTKISNVKNVSASWAHSLAVKTDGTVYAWGNNSDGQLGIGDYIYGDDYDTPQKVYGLTNVKQVAAGEGHSLALKTNGTVYAWGDNEYGQIGQPEWISIPKQIEGLSGIVQIATRGDHSFALKSDGTVYAWGYNEDGELGLGYESEYEDYPQRIPVLSGVKQIGAAGLFSIALMNDGTVKAWGGNWSGELGLGDDDCRNTPTTITGLSGVSQISVGLCHTLALMSNGTVKAWGYNDQGQLGIGDVGDWSRDVPTTIPNLTGVKQVIAGNWHSLAIKNDGTIWAWGYNYEGQAGIGNDIPQYTPVQVPGITFNSSPAIDAVISPAANQRYKAGATIIPQIKVHDPDGNTLNMTCRIDGTVVGTLSKSTNTATPTDYTFASVPANNYTDANHTVTFEVSDGSTTTTQSVTINVDKTAPTIGSVSYTPTYNTMTVAGSATDATSGLDAASYRYTVAGGSVNYQSGWTAETSYTTPAGLTPNTSYTVTFEAIDKAGNKATKQQAVYTKAQTPVLAISSPTTNSLLVSTTDGNPAATQYQITTGGKYVTASGSLTSTATWITLTNKKITVAGLNNNTKYSFTAKARNAILAETVASTAASGTTLSNAPSGLRGTPGINEVKLDWNAINGATGYDVYADGAEITNISENTYTHRGLGAETTHTYKVRARNAGGTGPWSSTTTVITLPNPPEIPTGLNAKEINIFDITVEWNAAVRAESYEIKISSGTTTNTIKGIAGISYKFTGLAANTEYTISIQAVNKGGESGFSSGTKVRTLPNIPDTPTALKAEPTTYTMKLTWEAAARAESYEIWVNNAFLASTTETIYLHEGLSPITKYNYKVRAWNAGGPSSGWSELEASTLPMKPDTPTNVTATAESTSVFVSWNVADRAESYKLRIDGDDSRIISGITTTGYTHEGLTPNTEHSYEVMAVNAGGESSWSRVINITTLPEAAISITNVAAIVKNTSITLSWDAVAAGVEYEVEVDGKIVQNGANTIYNHSGLTPVSQHNYKVRPVKDGAAGEWCTVITLSTLPNPPNAPNNITATVTNTTIQLTWEAAADATGYDIEIDDGVKIETVTGSSFTHEGLTPGTQHSYRIRAKNIGGVTAWSAKITESTINPSYTLEAEAGEEYHLALTASGIQDFNGVKFVVTYDPAEMEIVDLYEATPEPDLVENGRIPGTGLSAVYSEGRIELMMDNPILPGKAWSGVISTITFRAKVDGQITINYVVQ